MVSKTEDNVTSPVKPHSIKVPAFTVFNPDLIVKLSFIPEQPLNAYSPILVTLAGITRSPVKPLHSRNALFPMLFTPDDIVRPPFIPVHP